MKKKRKKRSEQCPIETLSMNALSLILKSYGKRETAQSGSVSKLFDYNSSPNYIYLKQQSFLPLLNRKMNETKTKITQCDEVELLIGRVFLIMKGNYSDRELRDHLSNEMID